MSQNKGRGEIMSKYELLTDISGYAKAGSISDLKKFKKELIGEWLKIGVVKLVDYPEINERIIGDKQKNKQIKPNRHETPEVIALREQAKSLGIDVKDEYGANKLSYLIKEKSKEAPATVTVADAVTNAIGDVVKTVRRGRPRKGA